MTIEQFLRQLARDIVEMEEESTCVGATASHLLTIIKESIKAEGGYEAVRVLASELDQATQEKEDEISLNETFHNLTEDLFTPDEEEAIYAGGDDK